MDARTLRRAVTPVLLGEHSGAFLSRERLNRRRAKFDELDESGETDGMAWDLRKDAAERSVVAHDAEQMVDRKNPGGRG